MQFQALSILGSAENTVTVRERDLIQMLLEVRCECSGHFNLVHKEQSGARIRYFLQCGSCQGMRTFSNAEDGNVVSVVVDGDRVKKLNRDHLESVFFALLGGNTYSNHRYSLFIPY